MKNINYEIYNPNGNKTALITTRLAQDYLYLGK